MVCRTVDNVLQPTATGELTGSMVLSALQRALIYSPRRCSVVLGFLHVNRRQCWNRHWVNDELG